MGRDDDPDDQADFFEIFSGLTNYVDSSTFSKQRKDVFALLKTSGLPSDVAIMICNWFFRKIRSLYRTEGKDRKLLLTSAARAHRRAKNIIAKGTYLNYTDRDATMEIAKYFYVNPFGGPEGKDEDRYFVLQLSNDVSLVNGLMQDPKFPDERLISHFIKWIKRSTIREQRSNLLDVLLLNYSKDPRVQDIFSQMRFDGSNKGLYGDQQNVHDEEISSSTLAAAELLMSWFSQNPISDEEMERYKGDRGLWVKTALLSTGQFEDEEGAKTLDLVITRLTLDQASFGSRLKPFGIMSFFMGLLRFISFLDSPFLTYPSLREEVTGMRDLCSSGYIERGIIVLQGIPGCEEFEIRISEKKRLFSVISSKLADVMKNAPDDVQLGSCDPEHQEAYLAFLEKSVSNILPSLAHFDESLDELLAEVMDEYSDVKGWKFRKGKLIRPKV